MTPSQLTELKWYARRLLADRQREYNMCKSKMAWGSRNLATRAIHRKHKREGVEPYRCPMCGQWHIGSRKAWRR